MSVTNAISGIIIIGGLLRSGHRARRGPVLGALAVLVAAINIAGGFTGHPAHAEDVPAGAGPSKEVHP